MGRTWVVFVVALAGAAWACGGAPGDARATGGAGATGGTLTGGGAGRDADGGSSGGSSSLGDTHTGNFWNGPVDYEESAFHNACAPSVKYPADIQQLYGRNIIGLANEVTLNQLSASAGGLCDACVELTAHGKSVIAHAITYGKETSPNDIDVSPELIAFFGAPSPPMGTWRIVSCPSTAPIRYTFDGRQWSNTWFFRVWVRNARLPVTKIEFQLGGGAWQAISQQSDGAWQADSQDFSKGFQLRITALGGATLVDSLPGLGTFDPDKGVASHGNFP